MKNNYDRIRKVLDFLESNGHHFETADDYAEPGYTCAEEGVVVMANWNPPRFPNIGRYRGEPPLTKEESIMPRAARILEKLGCECEWYDEWCVCCSGGSCNKAVRTQANGWGWTPSYKEINGEICCAECLAEDPDEYFEEIDGGGTHTITSIDAEKAGYKCVVKGYERGMHTGMNDHPDKINEALEEKGVERWFYVIHPSQFYIEFDLWVHESESDKVNFEAIEAERGNPSLMLKTALAKVSMKPNTISHINTETGEVTEEPLIR
jgi:hypothetical protein